MGRKFSVVVAMHKSSHGIGQGGQLPWKLRADMLYFKQLTRSTRDATKRNAVIMGRKTWQSIPPKLRPLDDRVNIVLSRNPRAVKDLELPSNVVIAASLERALELLDERTELGRTVEGVYVIGGASVYAEALALDGCVRLHVTEIERADASGAAVARSLEDENGGGNQPAFAPPATAEKQAFECDTFFPPLDASAFSLDHRSPAKVENGLRYEFVEYTPTVAAAAADISHAPADPRHEEDQYLDLVREVIEHGTRRDDRTGVGTFSKFGAQVSGWRPIASPFRLFTPPLFSSDALRPLREVPAPHNEIRLLARRGGGAAVVP